MVTMIANARPHAEVFNDLQGFVMVKNKNCIIVRYDKPGDSGDVLRFFTKLEYLNDWKEKQEPQYYAGSVPVRCSFKYAVEHTGESVEIFVMGDDDLRERMKKRECYILEFVPKAKDRQSLIWDLEGEE